MKINFKKIASVLASTVMIGSTIAFATAAWPAPFVKDGVADAAIVYGQNAIASDMLAATDLGATLDKSVTVKEGATISGTGDQVNLASSSKINFADLLTSGGRSTLTNTEMPNTLADGTFTDDAGTTYTYSQIISVGSSAIAFGTSGGDVDDPILHIQVGTDAATPLYTYKLNLNKVLDVSNSSVKGHEVSILGQKYTIGSGSNTGDKKVVLYGSGVEKSLKEGETATVTINGAEHTVEIVAITQSTTDRVTLAVDGGTPQEIVEGASGKVGGLDIYAKTVIYSAKESTTNTATLLIGSNKITLQNAQKVTYGSDDEILLGTNCTITGTGDGISQIQVAVAKQKTTTDYIKDGDSFVDPVFGGLRVNLVGTIPTLKADARDQIVVDTDNNLKASVTFTSALAKEEGQYTLDFAYDNDTSTSTVSPILAHAAAASSGRNYIHVLEGENAKENDYIVVNEGDKGMILRVDSVSFTYTGSNNKVSLSDIITGTPYSITLNSTGATANAVTIGGGQYFLNNVSTDGVKITWGTGAAAGSVGTYTTLFPRLQLANGEFMAIVAPTNITNGTAYILPNGGDTLDTTAGTANIANLTTTGAVAVTFVTAGSNAALTVNWTTSNLANTSGAVAGAILGGIDPDNDGGIPECNFNQTYGPAILLMEKKQHNQSTYGDYICIPLSTAGTSPVEIAVAQPVFKDSAASFTSLGSNSYLRQAVDRYGDFVQYDISSGTNNKATIYNPLDQMYVDIVFSAAAVSVGSSSITVVTDDKVDSVASNNLIVVGGSCINKAAAMILTNGASSAPICGDAWAAQTTAGPTKYLIQVSVSPYNNQKIAMLVAGYEGPETTKAVAKVKDGTVSTDVGTKLVLPQTTS